MKFMPVLILINKFSLTTYNTGNRKFCMSRLIGMGTSKLFVYLHFRLIRLS